VKHVMVTGGSKGLGLGIGQLLGQVPVSTCSQADPMS
jgi:NAD(P)-dependent dehydrogenase (short-subunit alcohol dehydrogenase family)